MGIIDDTESLELDGFNKTLALEEGLALATLVDDQRLRQSFRIFPRLPLNSSWENWMLEQTSRVDGAL